MSEAIQELRRAYDDRHAAALRWRSDGGTVVGYVGADAPIELLAAGGMLPVRLAGDPSLDTTPGDRYLGRGIDPVARSILTRLLAGHYHYLDRIVVSRDCEASLRLYYALRELRRVEPSRQLPDVYLVDILHLPHRTTTRYNRVRLAELRQRLEAWSGNAISETEIDLAVSRHNDQRMLLTEVAGLRRQVPARLRGVEALAIIGAGTCLPVEEHIALLRKLLAEAAGLPAHDGRRIYLTGSSHDTADVYADIENDGAVVVGEDHDWGDLSFETTVGASTIDALAERYQYNGPTAQRASIADRARYTAMAARRSAAQLLLCYARRNDEAPPWDFAAQRAAVAENGLPTVQVERQDYGRIAMESLGGVG